MKRILIIMIWLCAMPAVFAAQPLHILKALDGTYRNASYAVETIVTGKQIKAYDLTLYHSLSVTDSAAICDLQRMMEADMPRAINKEVGMHRGKINYGFFEFLPSDKNKKRFVFFFSNDVKAVVIYMEGDTSIDKIKSIIKR